MADSNLNNLALQGEKYALESDNTQDEEGIGLKGSLKSIEGLY